MILVLIIKDPSLGHININVIYNDLVYIPKLYISLGNYEFIVTILKSPRLELVIILLLLLTL